MDSITISGVQLWGGVIALLCVGVLIGAGIQWISQRSAEVGRAKTLRKSAANLDRSSREGFNLGVEAAWIALPPEARDIVRARLHSIELRADDEQVSR